MSRLVKDQGHFSMIYPVQASFFETFQVVMNSEDRK